MKIKIIRQDIYIPNWKNNHKLPKGEQITIDYSYMTAEQEERFSLVTPRYSGELPETKTIEIEFHTNANAIWDECVKKVNHLFDENGKEITDPKAVRSIPGIYGLITEVVGHIKKGIEEEEAKN